MGLERGPMPDHANGWSTKRLGEICSILSGGTPPKSDPSYWKGDLPWASGKDLKVPRLRDTIDHITREAAETYSRVAPAGSVLALVRGMGLANGFAVSLVERPMAFNQDLKALVPSDVITGAFLMYALTWASSRMLENVSNAAHGTKRLSQDDILGFELPYPPKHEQAAITAALDAAQRATDVDNRALGLAEDLKRAALRDLFTRGLRGKRQKETEFGPVPETWDVAALEQVAFVQTGVAKGRSLGGKTDVLEVPYLRVANVQDGHLDLGEVKTIQIRRSELERYLLREGDVVLTEGGDFDKLGRGFIWRGEVHPCVHQNHVFAVRVDRRRLVPEFLAYLAQSAYGKAYFLKVAHKTTNLACINTTKLKALPVLVPDPEEQRDIVSVLEAIDRKIDLHRRKGLLLAGLCRSLLHGLMVGAVRASDLDLPAISFPAEARA